METQMIEYNSLSKSSSIDSDHQNSKHLSDHELDFLVAILRLHVNLVGKDKLKQRELLFLPGWVLLSSVFLFSLPIWVLETGIWTCLTYFTIGFTPSTTRSIFSTQLIRWGLLRWKL